MHEPKHWVLRRKFQICTCHKKKIYIFLKKNNKHQPGKWLLGFPHLDGAGWPMGLCTHGPIHPWHMLGGAWIAVVPLVGTGQCGVWLRPGRSSRWCLPAAPICSANPVSPLDATWLLLWQQLLVGVAPWEGSQELWPHWMAWKGQMVHWQCPINGLAGLGGRPGWTGLAGSLGTLGGLVPGGGMGHVHGCPGGSMGGMGYGALGRIGLAALMGPFHGGSSPGDLTVWMPLATGEPGGTELGGNLGVKPPWLVLTGCALAACQYNAAGALTKRKINQPLRLLAGQVAMAPAGDVRYMTNEYYITMSNGLGILGNSWSWRLLLGIHNWLLLGNSWANLPAQTKQKN